MSRTFTCVVVLGAAVGLYQAVGLANGSAVPSTPSSGASASREMSPEERAVEAYKSGDDHRIKGRKLEDESLQKQGKDRDKLVEKARGEFSKSLKDFTSASQLNPKLFQAYNGMGYALRKTGDYAKALEMYDRAITMAPGFFSEAVEYRAEAYLALNRLDDAKKAYLDLYAADRKQADALMVAMKSWVEKRKTDAAGVDPAALSAFASWIGERDGVATDTKLMALSSKGGW